MNSVVYILIENWEALGKDVHGVYATIEDAEAAKETLDFTASCHDMFIGSEISRWDVSL